MSGNVWEWVQDGSGHYDDSKIHGPGHVAPLLRGYVHRGGSFTQIGRRQRVSQRDFGNFLNSFNGDIGFRLVRPVVSNDNGN